MASPFRHRLSVSRWGPTITHKVFFFKQKTAYEIMPSLVGSEMCIRDRFDSGQLGNVVGISAERDAVYSSVEVVGAFDNNASSARPELLGSRTICEDLSLIHI